MWVKETDYWYRDYAIDILDRLEMLKKDIEEEIKERTQSDDYDISFLNRLLDDVSESIELFSIYKG